MGAGYGEYFGPRRRKTFSSGSKVEPRLKSRTKASLSTNGHYARAGFEKDKNNLEDGKSRRTRTAEKIQIKEH
jgi:hypothetical protein